MRDTEPIFVVHVPKTAGTSFFFYLRQHLPAAGIFPAEADPLEARFELEALWGLSPERRARVRAYTGHYPAFVAEAVGAGKTVTLLRDPVDRVISMLKMRQRPANPPTGRVLPRTPHMTLAEIYDDTDMRPWTDNVQARMFAMVPADRPRSFLDPIALDAARLDVAKERLASIDVIGVQEDFGGLLRSAADAFGWSPPRGEPRAFVSDDVLVPDGLRDRIEEDMAWDRPLYDFALRLVAERRS